MWRTRGAEAIAPITMALAASANRAFRFTLEGKGVPPDLHEGCARCSASTTPTTTRSPAPAMPGLTDRWGLAEFLVDRFAIAGTPDDCAAQIRRAMGAGARQFITTGFVPDPRASCGASSGEVAEIVCR